MTLFFGRITSGAKIQLLQMLLCGMIFGLVALNYMFGQNQKALLNREAHLVERLGAISRLAVEIKNLQIHVIQVQQFLTDVSATRALDGYDDGPEVAEEHALSFEKLAEQVVQQARALELPEIEAAVEQVKSKFPAYYDNGKRMAESYIKGGPAAGNSLMETFDATALAIGASLDELAKVGEEASTLAVKQASDLKDESASFERMSFLLGLLAIATGVAAVVFTRILDKQARAKQEEADRLKERQADDERSRAEQTAMVISVLGDGLEKLAHGDLTCKLLHQFPRDFDPLREHFNETVDKLNDTLIHVRTGSEKINIGTGEIANASEDLARRTETQAASLEETAAAVREITAAVQQSAERTNVASQDAAAANEAARESGAVVEQAISKMGRIQESSNKIVEIIGVIDEIAFQTNLLALNAGVEAARAGEAGRGFAVVASEVRELSERSATAARGIKTLLESSATEIRDGVTLVGEAGKSLMSITRLVASISKSISDLSSTANTQSLGLREVSVAVEQMDQVTQQNAAMVEEANAATRSLGDQTDELARLVGLFNTRSEKMAA